MELDKGLINGLLDRLGTQTLVMFLAFSMGFNVFGVDQFFKQLDKNETLHIEVSKSEKLVIEAQGRTIELQGNLMRRQDDDIRRLTDTSNRKH